MAGKHNAVFLFLFIFSLTFIYLLLQGTALIWDENAFLANARDYIYGSEYTEKARFPGLSQIIALVWLVTGENVFIAKLITVFFGALLCVGVYFLAREFGAREREALLVSVLFALNPLYVLWSTRIHTDIPAASLAVLSVYFLLRREWLKSGLFAGLSFTVRYTYGPLFLGLLYGLLSAGMIGALKYGIGMASILVPEAIHDLVLYGSPVWTFFAQLNFGLIAQRPESPLKGLLLLLITGAVPFAGYALSVRKEKKSVFISALLAIFFVYNVFIIEAKYDRYLLHIVPFLYALSAKVARDDRYLGALVFFTMLSNLAFLPQYVGLVQCSGMGNYIYMAMMDKNVANAVKSADVVLGNCCWVWFGYKFNKPAYFMDDWRLRWETVDKNVVVFCGYPFLRDCNEEMLSHYGFRKIYSGKDWCDHSIAVYSLNRRT